MKMEWMKIGKCLGELLFPRLCAVCGRRLCLTEEALCAGCLRDLPRTNYHKRSHNPCEELFYGRIRPEQLGRATAFFLYERDSPYKRLLWALKYHRQPEIGRVMGRLIGQELQEDAFFNDIDLLMPVPLAEKRLRQRGYNQCAYIVAGLSEATGLPAVVDVLKRTVANDSQTRKSRVERQRNVEGIFEAADGGRLAGKHILLVDDVMTSGSTLIACAVALQGIPGLRLSFLTMACAKVS